MLCYLPRPYPDELLYSVIARYCLYFGINIFAFARKVFEKGSIRLRADLPVSLQKVAEKTYPVWRLSSVEILHELTLFPYYEPFLPEKSKSKKIFGLIHGGTCSAGLIGVNSFRVKSPVFLRYCMACRSKDLEKYGETYWHRMHQLPGTLVCLEHATPLVNSSALIQPMLLEIGDATIMTEDIPVNDVHLDESERELATMVAIHCQKILLNNNKDWQGENLARTYRDAALERGFSKIPGVFSPLKFKSAFKNFFSNSFLELIGITSKRDRLDY
jgi:hypothetical protein